MEGVHSTIAKDVNNYFLIDDEAALPQVSDVSDVSGSGVCPPTWDGWQCWEGGAKAGEVEERHCPAYIYFFTHGAHNGVGCQSKSTITVI